VTSVSIVIPVRNGERYILEAIDSVLVQGEIIRDNLHRDRLTADEIESEIRLAGIAHISDVEWAILEPQGKISFIKRSEGASRQRDADDGAV